MSRAWRPASVLTCTPRTPRPHPSICLWPTSCLPSFILNTCLCLGLRPRAFSMSSSSPDNTKWHRPRPRTAGLKLHRLDKDSPKWRCQGLWQGGGVLAGWRGGAIAIERAAPTLRNINRLWLRCSSTIVSQACIVSSLDFEVGPLAAFLYFI